MARTTISLGIILLSLAPVHGAGLARPITRTAAPVRTPGVVRIGGVAAAPLGLRAGISAPGFDAARLAPALTNLRAPSLAPALPGTEEASLAAVGLSPLVRPEAASAPEVPMGVRLERMSDEVVSLMEAAGPVAESGAEGASGLGAGVFRALTGEGLLSAPGSDDGPASPEKGTLTQRKMVQTLTQVASIFSEQYAPIEWKQKQFQLDLKREFDKATAAVLSNPGITTPQFQDIIAGFVSGMRDYHVSVSFIATERARLPLLIMKAGDKYVIARVDRSKLPYSEFPFMAGDEVVEFGGKPTAKAVQELAAALGGNTFETDLRLAELFLTNRRRSRGDVVPQGPVGLTIRDRRGKESRMELAWEYTPEQIPQNIPVRDAGLMTPDAPGRVQALNGLEDAPLYVPSAPKGLRATLGKFFADMAHPLKRVFADLKKENVENPFMIGSRKSYVPALGEVLWESKKDSHFHAYIFKTAEGKKVGFVRIAAYDGGREEVEEFGRLMGRFQKETDSLVIDQVNNPGGAVFYLYALASYLTDKPMPAPRHRMIVDESDAQWAVDFLKQAEEPGFAELAKLDPGDEWAGYPVTESFWQLMKTFARFILSELGEGRRLTGPTHLWGVDAVNPAPNARQRYTKPILLLVNELDFSGGDFFPAILQDNKRAKLMGVRTSGAGGAVKSFKLPNQFGMSDLSATWTIAGRPDGRPIENLGVTPDIAYSLTQKDFRTGFAEYRLNILKALKSLMGAAQ